MVWSLTKIKMDSRTKNCRTCLKQFRQTDICFRLCDFVLKNKLKCCVPELMLSDSMDEEICSECEYSLQIAYHFRIKCLDVEQQLSNTKHISSESINTEANSTLTVTGAAANPFSFKLQINNGEGEPESMNNKYQISFTSESVKNPLLEEALGTCPENIEHDKITYASPVVLNNNMKKYELQYKNAKATSSKHVPKEDVAVIKKRKGVFKVHKLQIVNKPKTEDELEVKNVDVASEDNLSSKTSLNLRSILKSNVEKFAVPICKISSVVGGAEAKKAIYNPDLTHQLIDHTYCALPENQDIKMEPTFVDTSDLATNENVLMELNSFGESDPLLSIPETKYAIPNEQSPHKFKCKMDPETSKELCLLENKELLAHIIDVNEHLQEYKVDDFLCNVSLERVKISTSSRTQYLCECKHCGARLCNAAKLMSHIRRHFNNRPYKCTLCDRSFYESYELRKHMIAHKMQARRFKSEQQQVTSVKTEAEGKKNSKNAAKSRTSYKLLGINLTNVISRRTRRRPTDAAVSGENKDCNVVINKPTLRRATRRVATSNIATDELRKVATKSTATELKKVVSKRDAFELRKVVAKSTATELGVTKRDATESRKVATKSNATQLEKVVTKSNATESRKVATKNNSTEMGKVATKRNATGLRKLVTKIDASGLRKATELSDFVTKKRMTNYDKIIAEIKATLNCRLCGVAFNNLAETEEHIAKHCNICYIVMTGAHTHKSVQHTGRPTYYHCFTCKLYQRRSHFIGHTTFRFHCDLCRKICDNRDELIDHLNTCEKAGTKKVKLVKSAPTRTAPISGRVQSAPKKVTNRSNNKSRRPKRFKKPEWIELQKTMLFACSGCDRSFDKYKTWRRHETKVHKISRRKRAKMRGQFMSVMKPIKCKLCWTASNTQLEHFEHDCTPNICNVCKNEYETQSEMDAHACKTPDDVKVPVKTVVVATPVAVAPIAETIDGAVAAESAAFTCDVCLKPYKSKLTYDSHICIDATGERVYRCQVCKCSFQRLDFIEHMKLHID